jgi:hypothetical protein
MNTEKLHFLKHDFVPLLKQLAADTKPKWGVMNAQQMVEHFSTTLRYANGRTRLSLHTSEDILPKVRAFMLSEKPFRENTKNPMMEEEPASLKHNSLQESVAELQEELNAFFVVFENDPLLITSNPIFGELTYEENIHLLYKHAQHHLKQFELAE